jgi:hypothetical protein
MRISSSVAGSSKNDRSLARAILACLLGATLGFLLMVLPSLLGQPHPGSVFVLVHSAVKGMSGTHLVLLFGSGFFWGLTLRWPYSLFAALFELASLPVFSIIEMFKDPTSHNLWPFEFMIYAVLTLVPLLGMSIGSVLKRRFKTIDPQP